jgi:hypothetical protein
MERPRDLKAPEGFNTEAQLVSAILSCLRSSPNRTYKVELELDAGVGFADVVLYKRQPRTTHEMKLLATIPPRLAPLLDPLTARHIQSCEDLATSLGLSISAAQRVMRQFQRLGLFNVRSSGTALASVKVPPFQTIISVEAKLSDWSRALVQAYRNRQFADESWVVLDHRFYKPALAQLGRFERSGVGLASVDVGGNLYTHFLAPAAPAMSSTKRWHAQAALARRVAQRLSQIKVEL